MEVLVAFSIFNLLIFFFFSSLAVGTMSQRKVAYRTQAAALAREALSKARSLEAGEEREETVEKEGLKFEIAYQSRPLPGLEEGSCRELKARVTVSRPPDPRTLFHTTQVTRVSELPL